MKYILRALNTIPDQVLSTFIMAAGCMVLYRGVVSLWKTPPSPTVLIVILGIGIVLGLLAAVVPPDYDAKKTDNKGVDEDKMGG
jgi:divalent metal cation (Fe/Co/Zn/Cd) transporter